MTFTQLLAQRETVNQQFHALVDRLTLGYRADVAADFKRAHPKKRWALGRAAACPHRDSAGLEERGLGLDCLGNILRALRART